MTASIIDKVVKDLGLEGIDWMDLTDEEAVGAIRLLLDEAENNPVYADAFRSIWLGASTVLRRYEVVAQLAEATAKIAAFEAAQDLNSPVVAAEDGACAPNGQLL